MKVKIILLLIFSLFVSITMLNANELVVTAEGQAAGTGLNAREKSIENALRNSIEKGFGVYVDSITLTENSSLISDDIVSESKGFVKSYKILEENKSNGLYTSVVKAIISMDKIWESDSLNLLLKRMGTPHFVIVSRELLNSEPVKGNPALQKMTEILVEKGFHLMDAPKEFLNFEVSENEISTNSQNILKIADKLNADIIVILNSKAEFEKTSNLYNKSLTYFNGICEAKVLQVDSSKVIASSVGKSLRGAENPKEAINDTLAYAAFYSSDKLVKGILTTWSKLLNEGRPIELEIKNVSVSQLTNIIELLKNLEGIKGVIQKKYNNKTAHLEIRSKHKSLYLAEGIEGLRGFKIKIKQFSDSKIFAISQ